MNSLEKNPNKIPNIKESYENLREAIGDETFLLYTNLLNRFFCSKISKIKFDEDARKLLINSDQIHLHNLFLLELSDKINSSCMQMKSPYEIMTENYVKQLRQPDITEGLCLPDKELLKGRICIAAIENGLEGADDAVTNMIHIATQMFIKNIITAMLSRSGGYKIRENNFQHGIGLPVANPWLRNTNNVIDDTQTPNVQYNEDENAMEPVPRCSLEIAQQQQAFVFSCSDGGTGNVKYTLKSLYETLFHNPHVINHHTLQSIHLERILNKLDCN